MGSLRGDKLLIVAFLETAAPRGANVVLVLEMGHGDRSFAWRLAGSPGAFSATRLVPIHRRASEMRGSCGDDGSFRVHVLPRIPAKLGKAYYALATTHGALGTVTELAGSYILPVRGHQRLAGKIAHHQVQGVDAQRPRALMGRTVAGNGNVHTLARAAFVSEIDLRHIFQRREIEDRPDFLAWHVERPCSTQLGTIGNDIRARG